MRSACLQTLPFFLKAIIGNSEFFTLPYQFCTCYDLQKEDAGIVELCMLNISFLYIPPKQLHQNGRLKQQLLKCSIGKPGSPEGFQEICKVKTFLKTTLEGDIIKMAT